MKKSAKCAGCQGLEVTMVTNEVSTQLRNSIRKYGNVTDIILSHLMNKISL